MGTGFPGYTGIIPKETALISQVLRDNGFATSMFGKWHPTLYRNTVPVEAPKSPEEGYHLTVDMTDEAIGWIRNTRAANKDKPWFCYFSTGAVHAPHHVPVWSKNRNEPQVL